MVWPVELVWLIWTNFLLNCPSPALYVHRGPSRIKNRLSLLPVASSQRTYKGVVAQVYWGWALLSSMTIKLSFWGIRFTCKGIEMQCGGSCISCRCEYRVAVITICYNNCTYWQAMWSAVLLPLLSLASTGHWVFSTSHLTMSTWPHLQLFKRVSICWHWEATERLTSA